MGDAALGGNGAVREARQFGNGVAGGVGRHRVVVEPLGRRDLGGQARRQEMAAEVEPEG